MTIEEDVNLRDLYPRLWRSYDRRRAQRNRAFRRLTYATGRRAIARAALAYELAHQRWINAACVLSERHGAQ